MPGLLLFSSGLLSLISIWTSWKFSLRESTLYQLVSIEVCLFFHRPFWLLCVFLQFAHHSCTLAFSLLSFSNSYTVIHTFMFKGSSFFVLDSIVKVFKQPWTKSNFQSGTLMLSLGRVRIPPTFAYPSSNISPGVPAQSFIAQVSSCPLSCRLNLN